MALENIIKSLKKGKNLVQLGLAGAAFSLGAFAQDSIAADYSVPGDHATIQEAIDAAESNADTNDTINIADGNFNETPRVNIGEGESLTLNGSSNTVIHFNYDQQTDPAIFSISGTSTGALGTVNLNDITINGGNYSFGWYWPESTKGLVVSNANLNVNNVEINKIFNYMVTIIDSTFSIDDLKLNELDAISQCDIGVAVRGSSGTINRLVSEKGKIDHTVDINNYKLHPGEEEKHSDVLIENSTIIASVFNWGECVRAIGLVDLTLKDNYFYRAPGGAPMPELGTHSGLSMYGNSDTRKANSVICINNVFDGLPLAVCLNGFYEGESLMLQSNVIKNCENVGIVLKSLEGNNWDGDDTDGNNIVDLGGGSLGSTGGNVFSNDTASGILDIKLKDYHGPQSNLLVYAIGNQFSTTNAEDAIWHHPDSNELATVVFESINVLLNISSANGTFIDTNKVLAALYNNPTGVSYSLPSGEDMFTYSRPTPVPILVKLDAVSGYQLFNGPLSSEATNWVSSIGSVPDEGIESTICFKKISNGQILELQDVVFGPPSSAPRTMGFDVVRPGGHVAETNRLYALNTDAILNAIANIGYKFSGWTGDVLVSNQMDNPLMLKMDGAKEVTANFEPDLMEIILISMGNGSVGPAETNNVPYGETLRAVFLADSYYELSKVETNGTPVVGLEGGISNHLDMVVYSNSILEAYFKNILTTNGIPHDYLAQHGFPTENSSESLDPDKDTMSVLAEYIAGTDPTNEASFFAIDDINKDSLRFGPVVDGRTYRVDATTNLKNGVWQKIYETNNVSGAGITLDLTQDGDTWFYQSSVNKDN